MKDKHELTVEQLLQQIDIYGRFAAFKIHYHPWWVIEEEEYLDDVEQLVSDVEWCAHCVHELAERMRYEVV